MAAKPLVESDRAVELMDVAEPGEGDLDASSLPTGSHAPMSSGSAVDNPYRDLQPFCDDDQLDWRCRGAAKKTRETVIGLMSERLSPLDAAALFWWARNQLYFEQHLRSR